MHSRFLDRVLGPVIAVSRIWVGEQRVNIVSRIMRRLRPDHAGRRQGALDRRQLDDAAAEQDRRHGPRDRRHGVRRRVPIAEPEYVD